MSNRWMKYAVCGQRILLESIVLVTGLLFWTGLLIGRHWWRFRSRKIALFKTQPLLALRIEGTNSLGVIHLVISVCLCHTEHY